MTEPMPMPPPAEPDVQPAKTKSKGEKLFDRITYAGFAGLGAFILTVPVTYLLKHSAKVQPYFERAVDGLHRGLKRLSPGIERATAHEVLNTTALMQGGNLMLLPIGILEHNKVSIVSGLNTMLGDPTPIEQIEQAPKQTWGSLIESRAVAWLAVFAAFKTAAKLVPEKLTNFENKVGELACKMFNKPIERTVAGKLTKSKTYLYGKIGALDIFATIAAATLLYVGGHFFARRHEEKKEQKAAEHHGGAPLKDELAAEQETPAKAQAPATQVTADKAHAGVLQAQAVAAQPQL